MKKIWLLIAGILLVNILVYHFIEHTDLSKMFGIPVNNWIYRIILIAGSLGCFWEYFQSTLGEIRS